MIVRGPRCNDIALSLSTSDAVSFGQWPIKYEAKDLTPTEIFFHFLDCVKAFLDDQIDAVLAADRDLHALEECLLGTHWWDASG